MIPIGDNKVMLFSGKGFQSGSYGDTWIFDLNNTSWIKDENNINPSRLESHELAETCLDGTRCVVLYAGSGTSGEINETWTFGGGDYITDIERGTLDLPYVFDLVQNYPNPFNPSTKISWQSPVGSWQTLKVYDVLGNKIVTLVDEYKSAERYEIEFNPESSIKNLASGIYFYRLKTGENIQN